MNDDEIISRFFTAVKHHINTTEIRFFSTFCQRYNMPRSTLLRMRKEPHRQFHPSWLSLMVSLGYSPRWLLTGKGEMLDKI